MSIYIPTQQTSLKDTVIRTTLQVLFPHERPTTNLSFYDLSVSVLPIFMYMSTRQCTSIFLWFFFCFVLCGDGHFTAHRGQVSLLPHMCPFEDADNVLELTLIHMRTPCCLRQMDATLNCLQMTKRSNGRCVLSLTNKKLMRISVA